LSTVADLSFDDALQTNAFNNVRMSSVSDILEATADIPEISSLARATEIHRSVERTNGELYCTHISQGSSLGSAGMAVIVDDGVQSLRTENPQSLILSLADDITVICKTGIDDAVALADQVHATLSAKHGLVENKDKREISCRGVTGAAIKILGAYIGPPEAVTAKLRAKVEKIITSIRTAPRW
jgi:hypothetical protein